MFFIRRQYVPQYFPDNEAIKNLITYFEETTGLGVAQVNLYTPITKLEIESSQVDHTKSYELILQVIMVKMAGERS